MGTELLYTTTGGQWKCTDLSFYELDIVLCSHRNKQEKLLSPRGVVGEYGDFKHFTLVRVWDCWSPGITMNHWREHVSEGAVWKKLSLWKQSWGKTRYRKEILCLNAKLWVPFSPLPWFPLFCTPQSLDSSPSSLPPALLHVCAGGPDWRLARLLFPILGLERWHIPVLHRGKGSTHGEKQKAWH